MNQANRRIYLSPPHMGEWEQQYLGQAFESNWIAPLGEHVDAFEREVAQYVGVKGAVAVSSGTAAIHLALALLGVQQGDTVFCSSFTFVASVNPISYTGASPVFIDSDPDSWNMSAIALERALQEAAYENRLPKAVIVVNLYGQSADMEAIMPLCAHYGVPVVEDAAESLGATYLGKASGTFGEYGVFSFNGNKIITTSGGGMLVSNNLEGLKKARFLATQARDEARYYQHSVMGYNYRLSNLLAAVGRGQMRVLEERILRRRQIFEHYQRELQGYAGIQFMPELAGGRTTRWLTVMTMAEEVSGISVSELIESLEEENIETRRAWKPMHLQPLYEGLPYYPHQQNRSVSDEIFMRGVCLPSGSSMTDADVERVISRIKARLYN